MKNENTIAAKEKLVADGADEAAVDAYIALGIDDDDLSNFTESYEGKFDSDVEFSQQVAENLGLCSDPSCGSHDTCTAAWPYTCIDWEWAARELMNDYGEQDGHYFRNI